jgi:hypothetical protein
MYIFPFLHWRFDWERDHWHGELEQNQHTAAHLAVLALCVLLFAPSRFRRVANPDLPQAALGVGTGRRPAGAAGRSITSVTSPRCAHADYRPRLGTTPVQPMSEGDAMSDLDRLEAAAGECREMIREAHAATKDLRAAVREAKSELHALTRDEVAAHIQLEVSRQLEELDERTREAISAATQKVIAEFDRFGESLLGKETYWQKASGRRAVTRPDTEVVTLDVAPDQDKG